MSHANSTLGSLGSLVSLQGEVQRHVVVAIDLSDQSYKALLWAAHDFARPGDMLHVTIQHNFPGASFDIPQFNQLDEMKHTEQVKEVIRSRFTSVLDNLNIPHVLHMFLETDNAPASAVAEIIFKISKECSAALIVIAAHNKAYGWNEFLLGSVADYCTQNCTLPLMVVRDYKGPGLETRRSAGGTTLVIPWHSTSPSASPQTSPQARDKLKALGMSHALN